MHSQSILVPKATLQSVDDRLVQKANSSLWSPSLQLLATTKTGKYSMSNSLSNQQSNILIKCLFGILRISGIVRTIHLLRRIRNSFNVCSETNPSEFWKQSVFQEGLLGNDLFATYFEGLREQYCGG